VPKTRDEYYPLVILFVFPADAAVGWPERFYEQTLAVFLLAKLVWITQRNFSEIKGVEFKFCFLPCAFYFLISK
jgi:hypothetical protein